MLGAFIIFVFFVHNVCGNLKVSTVSIQSNDSGNYLCHYVFSQFCSNWCEQN